MPCCIYNIRKILQGEVKAKNLEFFIDTVDVVDENIICDKVRLSQIILNCTSNAVKYTKPGGTVGVRVIRKENAPEGYADFDFIIRDTGIGMHEEFVEHIFEPISREETNTVHQTQGTGLGMSIVKNIVDMMGGRITARSKPIFLSELYYVLQKASSPQPEKEKVISYNDTFKGKRMLLADDVELNREIAQAILEEAGLHVETCSKGREAVEYVKNADAGHIDMILMDIMMPITDGYEASRQIRALPDADKANVPIVALTANAFEEDRQAALDAGMNDHISKPVQIEALYAVMRQYLR